METYWEGDWKAQDPRPRWTHSSKSCTGAFPCPGRVKSILVFATTTGRAPNFSDVCPGQPSMLQTPKFVMIAVENIVSPKQHACRRIALGYPSRNRERLRRISRLRLLARAEISESRHHLHALPYRVQPEKKKPKNTRRANQMSSRCYVASRYLLRCGSRLHIHAQPETHAKNNPFLSHRCQEDTENKVGLIDDRGLAPFGAANLGCRSCLVRTDYRVAGAF